MTKTCMRADAANGSVGLIDGRPRLKARSRRSAQRGFTLAVGLLMLALVTLVVVAGYNLGSSNLKVVYNVQVKDEAVAAAQSAMNDLISTANFTNVLKTTPPTPIANINVDIDGNGTSDYTVSFQTPVCSGRAQASGAAPSDVELGSSMSTSSYWNTDWELQATVADTSSGATVTLREGVRLRQSLSEADQVCPNS